MSFSGFSEDDIRKLTRGQDGPKQKGNNKTSLKKVTLKPSHNVNNSSKSKPIVKNPNLSNSSTQELTEDEKLSVSNKLNNTNNNVVNNTPKLPSVEEEVLTNEQSKLEGTFPAEKEKKNIDLDEFEARQKLIEEQNRKRKELLAKALADRTKQTQEEAQRLNEIQEEFKKLDAVLSADVKILRKQIEIASFEYMECQKKYHKVEKEYLDAKLVLHQKQEKKEMLTEHLCTIIEKNEERKAEKLDELLQKLHTGSTKSSVETIVENVEKS